MCVCVDGVLLLCFLQPVHSSEGGKKSCSANLLGDLSLFGGRVVRAGLQRRGGSCRMFERYTSGIFGRREPTILSAVFTVQLERHTVRQQVQMFTVQQ